MDDALHYNILSLTSRSYMIITALTVVNSAVPIFLFQSGHGGGVESHKLLLQKIANTGYCVIVPQHPNDTGNNQYGLPPNKEAAAAVFTGNCLAELQTDGTHLEAAYKW